jgi:hypothetical protein
MVSTPSRFSEASATSRMCSGRLLTPRGAAPPLRSKPNFVANRLQALADQLLIDERPIDLGGVEEGHAQFDGPVEDPDRLSFIRGRSIGPAHAHAAEPDGGDLQSPGSEYARFHPCFSLGRASERRL